METKETSLRSVSETGLLKNTEYYKYIFKKTEKMACAVFYILRSDQSIGHTDAVVNDLESAARKLIDVSLESLKSTSTNIEEHALNLKHALIGFESRLQVANAARLLSSELLEVFSHEIDSVQRSLKRYTEPTILNPLNTIEAQYEAVREKKPARIRGTLPSSQIAETATQNTLSRRERVLNVVRDKGEATIKDIVNVVTDCSEKTIQRELISLIKDNIVLRLGERRWSKYKVV